MGDTPTSGEARGEQKASGVNPEEKTPKLHDMLNDYEKTMVNGTTDPGVGEALPGSSRLIPGRSGRHPANWVSPSQSPENNKKRKFHGRNNYDTKSEEEEDNGFF